jgi:hypothetical protein
MLFVSDSARESLKSLLEGEKAKDRQLVLYLQGAG